MPGKNRSNIEELARLVKRLSLLPNAKSKRRELHTTLRAVPGIEAYLRIAYNERRQWGLTSKDALAFKKTVAARLNDQPVRSFMELLWAFENKYIRDEWACIEWAAFVLRQPAALRSTYNGLFDKDLKCGLSKQVVNIVFEELELDTIP